MLVKLLNKIGLYTAGQYIALKRYYKAVEERNQVLSIKVYEIEKSLSELMEENKSLRLKIAKRVKRRKR